jgi:hypothetical protein
MQAVRALLFRVHNYQDVMCEYDLQSQSGLRKSWCLLDYMSCRALMQHGHIC